MSAAADNVWWTTCPNGRQCPGYRDNWRESYCCNSKVKPGDFFCCDYETKTSKDYNGSLGHQLPELVGAIVGGVALLLLFIFVICFYCKRCALYKRRKSGGQDYDSSSDVSRHGDCIVHRLWTPVPSTQLPFSHHPFLDHRGDHAAQLSPSSNQKFYASPPPPYSSIYKSGGGGGGWCPIEEGAQQSPAQV